MSEKITVNRQMGCTVEELLYWLPAATNQKIFQVKKRLDGALISFPEDGIELNINLGIPRKIALLVIPVLNVTFEFASNWSKLEVDAFMKRFDLYTQRGGG